MWHPVIRAPPHAVGEVAAAHSRANVFLRRLLPRRPLLGRGEAPTEVVGDAAIEPSNDQSGAQADRGKAAREGSAKQRRRCREGIHCLAGQSITVCFVGTFPRTFLRERERDQGEKLVIHG
jgi:hypothetical protein